MKVRSVCFCAFLPEVQLKGAKTTWVRGEMARAQLPLGGQLLREGLIRSSAWGRALEVHLTVNYIWIFRMKEEE